MAETSRRRNWIILIVVLLLALLLVVTCYSRRPAPPGATPRDVGDVPRSAAPATSTTAPSATTQPEENLTAATLSAPAQVAAGAAFDVAWTGPDNHGDFVTIVQPAAPANENGDYEYTERGPSLNLTAPMQSGGHELRYVTGQSRTILARQSIEVLPVTATVQADEQVMLGAKLSVAWTGPNNKGDYITIVPAAAPDEQYGDYAETEAGSPVELTAPPAAGDAEVRYIAAQGRKVLARRPIRVTMPEVSLSAPDQAVAGSTIQVKWTGPNNAGDYVTVVAAETPDGRYENYTETKTGNPVDLLIPIMTGGAELRYQTGQGNKVLSRRPIQITAAEVKLSADAQCAPGAEVSITWSGPNHPGDYLTIVPAGTPDGQYAAYTETSEGSPLTVVAPKESGDAEIRYMTGQGNKVLARIAIRVAP